MRRVVSKELLLKEKLMRMRAASLKAKDEAKKVRRDNIIYLYDYKARLQEVGNLEQTDIAKRVKAL